MFTKRISCFVIEFVLSLVFSTFRKLNKVPDLPHCPLPHLLSPCRPAPTLLQAGDSHASQPTNQPRHRPRRHTFTLTPTAATPSLKTDVVAKLTYTRQKCKRLKTCIGRISPFVGGLSGVRRHYNIKRFSVPA